MTSNHTRIPLTVLILLLSWLTVWGEPAPESNRTISADDTNRAVVVRARNQIAVDGLLTEPDWGEVEPIGELVQREPKPGEKATERTEVKLLHDGETLFIGVMCFDSEPERIIGTQMARDADLDADDQIEILIDTFRDRRNAFYFATNPAGALVDGLIVENGQLNSDWNAIWNVKTRRSDRGWSAEFAIPFKSLSFNQGRSSWGFNVSRTIKRKLEEDRWASPRLDVRFFQVSEAGEIEGLVDIEQGHGLDVRPYASGRWIRSGDPPDHTLTGKGGADIFYNLTPNLKLTTTFNTDFAETEVDNRQINLTRFPLFFPEKRAFFLENAGVFNFSNTGSDLLPFFSRRIGLRSGREVPILFGTKLTGKVDRYDLGLLGVRTRRTGETDAETFFVGRAKRNLFTQSYIGGIFTSGDPASRLSSRTYGVDAKLATSRFLGGERNFRIDTFAVKSSNEGVRDGDSAFGGGVSYPNDLWDISMNWRQVNRNFRPALGFVPRTNVRRLFISAEYNPRPKNFLNVRQMFHEFRFTRFTRLDHGQVESWRLFTAPINWRFNSGDRIEFNYVPQFERLFEPFEIADGVVLPPGDYRFSRWRLEFGTASKRRWEVEGSWWFGQYWTGHADEIEAFFQYKLAPHFQASFEAEQTYARLPQGHFVARVFSLRADYSVTPFLTFYNLVEFDNESRNLGWQGRVRWILRPGNEVFIVFNQGWLQDERGGLALRSADTRLAMKVQYTFRF